MEQPDEHSPCDVLTGIQGQSHRKESASKRARESKAARIAVVHEVEFLWFEDCPNQEAARTILAEAIDKVAPGTTVRDIDATDPEVAKIHRFPGSPTIRVDGKDVDPSFIDPGDYTPRCRLFRSDSGIVRVPERRWIEDALR